jgi:hypothetical protein
LPIGVGEHGYARSAVLIEAGEASGWNRERRGLLGYSRDGEEHNERYS